MANDVSTPMFAAYSVSFDGIPATNCPECGTMLHDDVDEEIILVFVALEQCCYALVQDDPELQHDCIVAKRIVPYPKYFTDEDTANEAAEAMCIELNKRFAADGAQMQVRDLPLMVNKSPEVC